MCSSSISTQDRLLGPKGCWLEPFHATCSIHSQLFINKLKTGYDGGESEVPLFMPPKPTTTTTTPNFYRARGEVRNFFFLKQRKVGRTIVRNSVTLLFMFIQFSTVNLFVLPATCRTLKFNTQIGNLTD